MRNFGERKERSTHSQTTDISWTWDHAFVSINIVTEKEMDETTKTKTHWSSQNYLSPLKTMSPNTLSFILVESDSSFSYPTAYYKFRVWRSNF